MTQIGRYRGSGGGVAVPGTNSFDQVANVAALANPALAEQLRYVATNRLTYRTSNAGASWVPLSLESEAATLADLANITQMLNNQRAYIAATSETWQFRTAEGWFKVEV